MEYAFTLISKLFAIILITLVGYYVGKSNMLGKDGVNVLAILLNRIAMPLMVVVAYIDIKLTKDTLINSAYIIVATIIIYLINLGYSTLLANKFKLDDDKKSVFVNSALHGNSGFLAFPLLLAVFGSIGLFYGSIFFMIDTSLMFSKGVNRLKKGSSAKKGLANVTKALIIGIALMIFTNLFNINITNNFVFDAVKEISLMTIPLAFIFIGIIISELNVKELIFNKIAIILVLIRMIVIPLIAIGIFYCFFRNLDSIIIIVLMVELLMPVFTSLLTLVQEYEKDTKLAASLVVLSHLVSIITIPVLFTLVILIFK